MEKGFKFRIFDKAIPKHDGELDSPTGMIVPWEYVVRSSYFTDALIYNRYPIMMYTGKHDLNGKEIYAGDILRNIDPENFSYILVEWNDKYACFQINGYGYDIYHNENSGEEYDNFNSLIEDNVLLFGSEDEKEMEIIGNIYSNPELLMTKKLN